MPVDIDVEIESDDAPGWGAHAADAADDDLPPAKRRDGRRRLLRGAVGLLAERGYAGMELRDVAERGQAPRGSIYHHFPGGKVQLAAEAARLEGKRITEQLERTAAEHGIRETLSKFGRIFRESAAEAPELIGCPVAAAALARPEDPTLAAAATEAFASWEQAIAEALMREGVEARRAEAFATLTVASIEGALLRVRAAGDDAPIDATISGLEAALDALLAES